MRQNKYSAFIRAAAAAIADGIVVCALLLLLLAAVCAYRPISWSQRKPSITLVGIEFAIALAPFKRAAQIQSNQQQHNSRPPLANLAAQFARSSRCFDTGSSCASCSISGRKRPLSSSRASPKVSSSARRGLRAAATGSGCSTKRLILWTQSEGLCAGRATLSLVCNRRLVSPPLSLSLSLALIHDLPAPKLRFKLGERGSIGLVSLLLQFSGAND